ncbi:MAG: oxygenase MpaB family protein [Actinomycetota bacterium]
MGNGVDVGLFGPGSVTWHIHSEPATLVGGLRALLVQALHPVAMAAVSQHSDYRTDPWGRFRRTSEYLSLTVFGSTDQAEGAGRRVRAIHRTVSGVDPVTGRRYRADDPDLLLWVHAVEVDSFLTAYRSYGGWLSDDDADRYVGEMVRSAELVGLAPEDVPHSLRELHAYLDGVDDLRLTPDAKEGMRYVLSPPMPLPMRPLWALPATTAVAILPRWARRMYGLPWFAPLAPVLRVSTFALDRALKLLLPPPPALRAARERVKRAA